MEYENGYFDDDLEVELEDPASPELEPISTEPDDFFNDAEPVKESVLTELLKLRGIENGVIKILGEDNVESEVNFSDLTLEEQLEILNNAEETVTEDEYNLDESEISLINSIRENGDSVEEYLKKYKQSIIDELSEQGGQNYDIDNYDDQELYLLDLKQKYNLTDDELARELEKELKDETLFKKKVDILRAEYKELEDQYKLNQEQQEQQELEEQYAQYSDTMVDIAVATNEMYDFELEDEEKNEILSFLLDRDESGATEFYKTLNDPKKMYEAAWFLRYGKESFDALRNAYESEISKLKKVDKKVPVIHKKNEETEYSIDDIINF